MGRDTRMKVLVRITTKEAVDNFAEIVKSADGCILARAYLAV
jgi:pyruvate kinase